MVYTGFDREALIAHHLWVKNEDRFRKLGWQRSMATLREQGLHVRHPEAYFLLNEYLKATGDGNPFKSPTMPAP